MLMNRTHMKSATTKNLDINTPKKFILRDFWSNFDFEKTHKGKTNERGAEISLIPLIKIFATDLMFCLADLIHWGFLDAFQFQLCV
jgi:hypothetical protein